ncbi:ankyrin repeat protein [Verticillium dahliae]
MDPIGIAGILIAFAQVSFRITVSCSKYQKFVKDAPSEVSRTRDEAVSIRNVAERLVDVVDLYDSSDSQATFSSLKAMGVKGGPLEGCLRELNTLEALLAPSVKKSRMFVLKWPLNRPEAEKSRSIMERTKSTLQLALAADNARKIIEIVDQVKRLSEVQDGVTSLIDRAKIRAKGRRLTFMSV